MDLMEKQADLQKEAHKILGQLQLIEKLSKYGKPEIIGSLFLGLMVWRDIDIEVENDNLTKEELGELVKNIILDTEYRIDFTVIYNCQFLKPHLPKGTYLGIKFYDHLPKEEQSSKSDKIWKIDIWFLPKENLQGSLKTNEIKNNLTDDSKKIILEIKEELWQNPKYKKIITSIDIYEAVLDKGVKNLEEFKNYLKESNREL